MWVAVRYGLFHTSLFGGGVIGCGCYVLTSLDDLVHLGVGLARHHPENREDNEPRECRREAVDQANQVRVSASTSTTRVHHGRPRQAIGSSCGTRK